ncbi:MAG: formylglycine-generating enzyme family protein [Paracoccaceae bacterium]
MDVNPIVDRKGDLTDDEIRNGPLFLRLNFKNIENVTFGTEHIGWRLRHIMADYGNKKRLKNFMYHLRFLVLMAFTIPAASAYANESTTYTLKNDRKLRPLEHFRDCDQCPKMIALPLGDFVMGAPLQESAFLYNLMFKPRPGIEPGFVREGPQHVVKVDIPFAMSENEITREEWMACVADQGCTITPSFEVLGSGGYKLAEGDRMPIFKVSYRDALEYVAWLNVRVGENVYRLPTAAEWEYAGRAGTTTPYAQGTTLTTEQVNFLPFELKSDGSFYLVDPDQVPFPVIVDELDAANPWGLRHMSGNVLEMTMSCITETLLGLPTTSAYYDAAKAGTDCRRVVKGGHFSASMLWSRLASRISTDLDTVTHTRGFRVLRQIKEMK